MKFKDLEFPRGLNLDLLATMVPEGQLIDFILSYAYKTRKERRIVLPSQSCIKKVICHFYGTQVEKNKMSWEQVMEFLKGKLSMFKDANLSQRDVKRLFAQRKVEAVRERKLNEFNNI